MGKVKQTVNYLKTLESMWSLARLVLDEDEVTEGQGKIRLWRGLVVVATTVSGSGLAASLSSSMQANPWIWGPLLLWIGIVLARLHAVWRFRKLLKEKDQRQQKEESIDSQPESPRKRREIPGAVQAEFKLYEAACLIAGYDPAWPLRNQKAKDEFTLLERDLSDGTNRSVLSRTFGYDFGFLSGQAKGHDLEIDRATLRKYMRSHDREIPEFLAEKYDD